MADNKKAVKTSSKPEKEKKSSEATGVKKVFSRIKQFFKDVRGETKKIVWNSRADTIKNTGVVLMVTLIVGSGVWVSDVAFRELLELIYRLAA